MSVGPEGWKDFLGEESHYCVPRKIRRGIPLKTMNALRLPLPTF